MKITRDTPDQLILESRPWVLATIFGLCILGCAAAGTNALMKGDSSGYLFFLGLPFFGLFIAAFIRRNQVILHRPEGYAEIRRRSVLGYSAIRFDLAEIDRAIVETSQSSDSDTHRAALVVPRGDGAGTHPLTLVYSSGSGAQRAAAAINHWLDSGPPRA